MPEGPEIRIASLFINQVASTHTFGGKVLKGEKATKLADVPFEATEYTLNAESRGKELKVTYSTHSSKTLSNIMPFLFFTILIIHSMAIHFTNLPRYILRTYLLNEKRLQRMLSNICSSDLECPDALN